MFQSGDDVSKVKLSRWVVETVSSVCAGSVS